MTAGTPSSFAASATPCAWFPLENATTPPRFRSGETCAIVLYAPRNLNAPMRWRFSALRNTRAPAAKFAATRGYGAEVVTYDRERMNRAELAASIAAERGATLVPPYDDPGIIAGAGTAVLELLEDAGTLDVILVPLGGGGLLAGSCLAASELAPGARVYGVEPEAGDDWVRSWRENRI